MDKNETLKGRIGSNRTRTVKKTKTEGSSRLSRERQIISVKQLKKLVKKKTPVFLAGGLGTRKQKGQCCSEVRVNWTHTGKEARPNEETRPKEAFPQC